MSRGTSRLPFWARLLLVLALLMPVIEIVVIVLVWHVIGWWTLAALAVCFVAGVLVIKRASREAVGELREAVRTGRPPSQQLADAPQLVVGGVLLLVPGFVTSVIGLIAILPGARHLSRVIVRALLARRVVQFTATPYAGGGAVPRTDHIEHDSRGGDIIEGEIVEDDRRN